MSKKLFYQRRRLITISVAFALIGLAYWYSDTCGGSRQQICESYIEDGIFISLILLIILSMSLLIRFIKQRAIYRKAKKTGGFVADPGASNKKIIEFEGYVIRILPGSFSEYIKRRITHFSRTLTGSKNHSHRHIHQRFLVQSPVFPGRESILVLHNTSFGKISVRKGSRVVLRGEYLHTEGFRRGLFGLQKTLYGKIHKTHEPEGFIKVLPPGTTLSHEIKVK